MAALAVDYITFRVCTEGLISAHGTKLPFAALQHYVGYWGVQQLNADVAFGPLMTQLRHWPPNLL